MSRHRQHRPPPPEDPPPGLTPAELVHFALLSKWRVAMDLVGPGPMVPHFIDAMKVVDALGPIRGRWADLGSGAGFPGIALAARNPTGCSVVLVESRRKRATFLQTVIGDCTARLAGLSNATVRRDRVENLQGPFDGLISRAYKAPEGVLQDALHLLADDGRVALMLGDKPLDLPQGWRILSQARYAVPDGYRRLVVVAR